MLGKQKDWAAKVEATKKLWTPLDTANTEAKNAAAKHKADNQKYLDAYDAADKVVKDLVAAAGKGSDETTAKENALKPYTDKTTKAEEAVAAARARVEALVLAKQTQVAEKSAWGERVTAANTAKSLADKAKVAADAAVDAIKEQVSKRSWLQGMLAAIDSSKWNTACGDTANSKPACVLAETASTADTSTWSWPANQECGYTNQKCTIMGLSASIDSNNASVVGGLIKATTTAKGTVRNGNTAPTLLEKDLEDGNYTFDSAGGTTLLAKAENKFVAW